MRKALLRRSELMRSLLSQHGEELNQRGCVLLGIAIRAYATEADVLVPEPHETADSADRYVRALPRKRRRKAARRGAA